MELIIKKVERIVNKNIIKYSKKFSLSKTKLFIKKGKTNKHIKFTIIFSITISSFKHSSN